MDSKLDIIHRRNVLMTKILWFIFIIDVITNISTHSLGLVRMSVIGLILFTSLALLVWKRKFVPYLMYITISIIYFFVYSVLRINPVLVNFVFVWCALVLSSIYHDYRPIIYASLLTAGFTYYYFFYFQEQIFPHSDPVVFYYLLLMDLFMTILLISTSDFSEKLRLKAEQNELVALEELQTTKQYLESFVNNTADAIDVVDLDGTVLRVNKAYETMFGWSAAEVINKQIKIIPEEAVQDLVSMWNKVHLGELVSGVEAIRKRKDGKLITASVTISPIRNEAGEIVAFATISRDITDRLRTHDLLRQSEKLSVVGQLAAGVAHEIRNPLTTIKGFIQLMLTKQIYATEQYMGIMLSEVDRINLIVSEFLILAKPQVQKYAQKDVKDILTEVITLINTQAIFKNIQIKLEPEGENHLINCDENQLKQVFINLIKNAIEAMTDSGTISIRVFSQDAQVTVQIIDQGCGIPADQLAHLGEPFFSTKGSGTGLGLMVSQRIIENHKGSISFQSEQDNGTCVEVKLPVG